MDIQRLALIVNLLTEDIIEPDFVSSNHNKIDKYTLCNKVNKVRKSSSFLRRSYKFGGMTQFDLPFSF